MKVLECEVWVDGMWLEHVSEFKFLGCVLASGNRVAGILGLWLMLGVCSLSVLES